MSNRSPSEMRAAVDRLRRFASANGITSTGESAYDEVLALTVDATDGKLGMTLGEAREVAELLKGEIGG